MDFLLRESSVPYRWLWLDDGQTPVVLDAIDYDWAARWPWARKETKKGPRRKIKYYAYRTARQAGTAFSQYLHKTICQRAHGPPPTPRHTIADHCNGQTLNCRRYNLRWATRSENRLNIDGAYALQLRMEDLWQTDTLQTLAA